MSINVKEIELFAIDLDGVVYRGETLLPGASDFINEIRRLNKSLIFITNSTLRPRRHYIKRLLKMGINADENEIITAAYATGIFLKKQLKNKKPKIFLLGEDGLKEELGILNPVFIDPESEERSDAVVVGLDRKINYEKICKAFKDILNGSLFIGVNGDYLWPVDNGFMPGVGVFLSALEKATGRSPVIVGKPNTFMLKMAIERKRYHPQNVLMIGDKLDSDIFMGKRAGVKTALVLSGVTTEDELKKAPYEVKPDIVAKDLSHLYKLIFSE